MTVENQILVGGNGFDYLIGGKGDDLLVGQDGGDMLFGGLGDDTLVGGNGADQFEVMIPTFGNREDEHDIIVDFDTNSGDVLWLNTSEKIGEIPFEFHVEQVGSDTVVTVTTKAETFTNVNTITLVGVQVDDISSDDYAIF